ncbi:NAD-dependent protein deacetylase Sirt2 [Phlebotomus argentipes]|uniref:NAD-dependent protein deacetylase Sirt2 n=1 Tax=Phlebotomus argentipes TaxID=94469 RepID=UPI002892F331|nr:NAD-dependent protein deacetylase Sirt2 [Phlebotomus argentipes]
MSVLFCRVNRLHSESILNALKSRQFVNIFTYSAMSERKENPDNEKVSKEEKAEEKPSTSRSSELMNDVEAIRNYLAEKLNLFSGNLKDDDDTDARRPPKVLDKVDFDGLMDHWKEKGFKNIVTMVGAGISTSAGIPDFRSPDTGLYSNLQKYNLPYPTAIFELDYFIDNPQPFFTLAKELYPGTFKPTPCHYFVKLLHDKGWLKRHYTQNIDTLERIAGVPGEKMVEAHGTFYTNHCLGCHKAFSMEWMKEEIFADRVPTCTECNGVVKPDIVFFGENLPESFHQLPAKDFKDCDLLIIMGTSLEVQPFASLPDRASDSCVRLLVNRELVGNKDSIWSLFSRGAGRMEFGMPESRRDVAWLGDCDEGVQLIADKLGFGDELRALVKKEHERIDGEVEKSKI